MGTGEVIVASLILAAAITKVVDTVRNAVDPADLAIPKVAWNVLALVLGVAGCLIFDINLLSELGISTSLQSTAGEVLTGAVVAGGAGAVHELLDKWSSEAKAAYPPSPAAVTEKAEPEATRRAKNPGA